MLHEKVYSVLEKLSFFKEIEYFIAGLDMESNRVASTETTQKIHNEYSNLFTCVGYFKSTFSLHFNNDTKPYHMHPRCVTYALKKSLKKRWKDYRTTKYWHQWGYMKWKNGKIALSKYLSQTAQYVCVWTHMTQLSTHKTRAHRTTHSMTYS